MNIEEKRQEVSARVWAADEATFDATLELMRPMSSGLYVAEDDSAQLNYGNKSKRFRLLSMIRTLGESELDAILAFLPPAPEFELSEEDLSIIKERQRRYEAGETKMVDAHEAGRRILEELRKKRK